MESDSSCADTLSTEADVGNADSISESTVNDSDTKLSSHSRQKVQSWNSTETGTSKKRGSQSQPLSHKYSRHLANVAVDESPDLYSDTFDSVQSLDNSEDETLSGSLSESTDSSRRSFPDDTYRQNKYPKIQTDDEVLSHNGSILVKENDRSLYSSDISRYSGDEEETASQDSVTENNVEVLSSSPVASLSLSFSSVWECSPSDASNNSLEDKFTSADGEIVYYSDFSADLLTARQYTYRSEDASEVSYHTKSKRLGSGLQEYLKSKIQLLKQSSLVEKEAQTSVKNKLVKAEESDDLKRFCSMKLNHLKKPAQVYLDSVSHDKCQERSNCFYHLKKDSDVVAHGISETAVQRLLDDRLSMIDFHELRSCDRCQHRMGCMALNEFLHLKTAIAREKLTNLQLQSVSNSSMYGMKIVGELLSEVSRLNHEPNLAMQRLLQPLYNRETCAN